MRNVVVYLVRGHAASLAALERSLALLKRNFLPWSPADVLIFHEDNLKAEQLAGRTSGIQVKTALVDFSAIPPEMADLPTGQRGYRHMCHFFANDIFRRPELAGYDYYMRLDDDSFILSPLTFDAFARMRERRFRYAYRAVLKDRPHVCKGLGAVIARHFEAHAHVGFCKSPPPYRIFYTNFEICDLAWFRGAAWQSYFAAVDRAGGIWKHRWGDAPIRYYGVMNCLSGESIWHLVELHYRHQDEWLPGRPTRTFREMLHHYWATIRFLAVEKAKSLGMVWSGRCGA